MAGDDDADGTYGCKMRTLFFVEAIDQQGCSVTTAGMDTGSSACSPWSGSALSGVAEGRKEVLDRERARLRS